MKAPVYINSTVKKGKHNWYTKKDSFLDWGDSPPKDLEDDILDDFAYSEGFENGFVCKDCGKILNEFKSDNILKDLNEEECEITKSGWQCGNCHSLFCHNDFKFCPYCGEEIDWNNKSTAKSVTTDLNDVDEIIDLGRRKYMSNDYKIIRKKKEN